MATQTLEEFFPDPPERPKIVTVTFRFRPEIRDKLGEIAEELGVTRQSVLHALIEREHTNLFE